MLRRAAAAVLLGALVSAAAPASDGRQQGAAAYLRYCASCHGRGGRGDGPLADGLTVRPRDLTTLARENGGAYPETLVYQVVDGRGVVSFHGPREMPVWGRRFAAEGRDEAGIEATVGALVAYLESLQRH